MPLSDFTQARGSILGSIINAAGNILGGFVQGPLPPIVGVPGNPPIIETSPFPDVSTGIAVAGCSSLSRRMGSVPQCYVPNAKNRKIKGRYRVLPNGQVICCPSPRRMNPANAHALTRAARRLRGFAKLEKRIHKALNRAMGPAGRRMGRSYARKCGTCRKSKCVC